MAQTRRRAFGSVTEVDSGRRYVVRWVQDTPQGRKRLSKTVRGTRREAERYLAQREVEHGLERPTATVGDAYRLWYEPWLERRVADGLMAPHSAEAYRSAWSATARGRWEGVPLGSVRPLDVQRWLLTLTKSKAQAALKVLHRVGDLAVRYEACEENKFRLPYEMPSSGREHPKDVLDLDGARKALALARGLPIEPCVILMAFGGCRPGEACAPRVGDVRDVGGWAVVAIDKQMGNAGREPEARVKTADSAREAVVPPPYSARLLQIAAERREAGHEWLCAREDGRPVAKEFLRREWARVGGPVPVRNLRNSWRTFAQYEWGVDWDTLELLMGHKLEGVTGKHYLRPTTEQLMQKMAAALAGSGHDKDNLGYDTDV